MAERCRVAVNRYPRLLGDRRLIGGAERARGLIIETYRCDGR